MKEEKKYKVVALSVGGLGNKIFTAGEIVKESNFPHGNSEKLVQSGFLKPEIEVEEKKSLIYLVNAKEIKELLTSKGIEFGKNDSKVDLYASLMNYISENKIEFDESSATKEDLFSALA